MYRNLTLGFLGFIIAQSWVFNFFGVATLTERAYCAMTKFPHANSTFNRKMAILSTIPYSALNYVDYQQRHFVVGLLYMYVADESLPY